MKTILSAILVVLLWAGMCFADIDDFRKADTNNDGKISKKEYNDAVIKAFNKIDKNKDGFLTEDELQAIGKIDGKKFMTEEDLNKDGKISREEFIKAAEKRFKFFDKNNDGFIDQKEWNDIKESINQKNSKTTPVAPLIIFSF